MASHAVMLTLCDLKGLFNLYCEFMVLRGAKIFIYVMIGIDLVPKMYI